MTIDRAEIAIGVGPFVPDADLVFLEVTNIAVALQKPEQFVNDRAQVEFFRGQQRETFAKVKAHLPAEHRAGTGTGAVGLFAAVFENMAHQVEIGGHVFVGES